MSFPALLLQRLASARAAENGAPAYVSGAALAADFNVTRSAIWKAVGQLRAMGTEIEAITHEFLRAPRTVQIGRRANPAETVTQFIYEVPKHLKPALLVH